MPLRRVSHGVSRRMLRLVSHAHRARRMTVQRVSGAARTAATGRSAFYERVWREAAEALGAEIRPVTDRILEIDLPNGRARVSHAYTPLDDPVTLMLAGDKPIIHRLLRDAGIAVPDHLEFTLDRIDQARRFLDEAGGSCVVKPARGTGGGKGVTTGVRSPRTLRRAAALAGAHSGSMLIERQTTGINYRLLFLDGQLLDAVERRPPTVVGDGVSSIDALLKDINADRLSAGAHGHALLTRDLDVRRTLDGQGLSLSSVPGPGVQVSLKTAINENSPADNITAIDEVCDEIVAEAARAVALVGARLCGVDVLTPEPSVSLSEGGGVILEVNTTPGFFFHYAKGDGTTCPVALHALQAIAEMPRAFAPELVGD